MGLFDFKLVKKAELESSQAKIAHLNKVVSDLKLSVQNQSSESKAIEEAIKERRRTLNRPLHYRTASTGGESTVNRRGLSEVTYYGPGYDLAEIGRAIDVEPYINQSVRKHREQILKQGYSITCDDDELCEYLYRRLFEMAMISGITTEQWLRDFSTNLVAYGTAFLVIKRDSDRSSGKTIRMYGKDREPMAALYPLDPTSVSVALNDYGHPVRWKQKINNAIGNQNEIVFDVDDVIVATIDKKTGFVFGTPYILPTLDDVRSLRRLEELAELSAQRNGFPMLHWKVGTPEQPAEVFDDGTDEVSIVRQLVEEMPSEGGIVTSARVEADLLGGDKQTMDLTEYLNYFEARVLGGLRLSEVDLGRSEASKASAVTVSQGLQDSARDFQAIIEDILTFYLLIPLALEGGYDIDPNENLPEWKFSTINKEDMRADQQHGQDMYLSGGITHEEFRRDYLSKKPLAEEEHEDLKPNKDHAQQKELAQMAGEQAIAKAKVSKSTSTAKKKSANKTRPKNQHGRKKAKTRVTKNSLDALKTYYANNISSSLIDARSTVWSLIDKHQGGVVSDSDIFDLSTKQEELQAAFEGFMAYASIECRKALDPILILGAKDALTDLGILGDYDLGKKTIDRFYKNYAEKSIRKLCDQGLELINTNDALSGISSDRPFQFYVTGIFDTLQEELNSLCDKHIDIAYRVGYARAARAHGISTIILTPDQEGWFCEDCEERGPIEVSLVDKNGSYASLLSTHGECEFTLTVDEK